LSAIETLVNVAMLPKERAESTAPAIGKIGRL
jgi:hypothetical protein